jgi:hypothetical protein
VIAVGNKILRLAGAAFGFGFAGVAQAALVLATGGYPAPGGTTSSASGSSIAAGGRTISYTGFNPSAYSSLYYVIGDYIPTFTDAGPRLWADGSPDQLTYDSAASNLAAGTLVWSGSTNVPLVTGANPAYGTRFTLRVTDLTGTSLALTSATSLGLANSLGGALAVPTAGFNANWLFELATSPGAATYSDASTVFNAISQKSSSTFSTSVGGGFYYEAPAAVPVPSSLPLLAGGLAVMGLVGRRRQR